MQEALDTSSNAKGLLESPAFQKAVGDLEKTYVDAWRRSKPGDTLSREDAYFMLRALDELQGNLKAAAAAGGIVAFNLRRTITEKAG